MGTKGTREFAMGMPVELCCPGIFVSDAEVGLLEVIVMDSLILLVTPSILASCIIIRCKRA